MAVADSQRPRDYPPARFVRAGEGFGPAEVDDSLICEGSIIASAAVREVVLSYDCFVHAGAEVNDSVILSGCDIGKGAKLRRVLLDKNVHIEPGCVIGYDAAHDREQFPFVTESESWSSQGTVVPAHGPCVLANDLAELIGEEARPARRCAPAPSWSRCRAATATNRPPGHASRSSRAARPSSAIPGRCRTCRGRARARVRVR
jgi:hypothetical protein